MVFSCIVALFHTELLMIGQLRVHSEHGSIHR